MLTRFKNFLIIYETLTSSLNSIFFILTDHINVTFLEFAMRRRRNWPVNYIMDKWTSLKLTFRKRFCAKIWQPSPIVLIDRFLKEGLVTKHIRIAFGKFKNHKS